MEAETSLECKTRSIEEKQIKFYNQSSDIDNTNNSKINKFFDGNLPGQFFSQEEDETVELQKKNKAHNLQINIDKKRMKEINNNSSLESASQEIIDVQTSSSSSSEFQLDNFRNLKINAQETLKSQTKFPNIDNNSPYLNFWGLKFEISKLQERNKDFILFLRVYFAQNLLQNFSGFVLFGVGLNFRIIPVFVLIGHLVSVFALQIYLCNKSIQNGLKIDLIIVVGTMITGTLYITLFLYSFLLKFPFNSLPLFLCVVQIYHIIFFSGGSLVVAPNFTPWNDPNYQLKFFSQRSFSGFFDGTGSMDALSDAVLGIQLIQMSSHKFLIIGIILCVLSSIDYFQVVRREIVPQKITIFENLVVVFNEVIVLVLTGVVFLDVLKISQGENSADSFYVTLYSLLTTIVNFSHNLVSLSHRIFSKYEFHISSKFFISMRQKNLQRQPQFSKRNQT
eukprot:TRINITY_DN4558_c0_g1_i1.p2 TRINITY_DN4558_c0_g1~~TRINITY_DN4558_c0_g1_i1.p2  ORF type:complete len:450 (+),score=22.46 TRINITY_DN4558_c0_g1_i1:246-1595(+)